MPLRINSWKITARYERNEKAHFSFPKRLYDILESRHFIRWLTTGLHLWFRNNSLTVLFFVLARCRLIVVWSGCHKNGLLIFSHSTSLVFHKQIVFATTHAVLEDNHTTRSEAKWIFCHFPNIFMRSLHQVSCNGLLSLLLFYTAWSIFSSFTQNLFHVLSLRSTSRSFKAGYHWPVRYIIRFWKPPSFEKRPSISHSLTDLIILCLYLGLSSCFVCHLKVPGVFMHDAYASDVSRRRPI